MIGRPNERLLPVMSVFKKNVSRSLGQVNVFTPVCHYVHRCVGGCLPSMQ